MWVLYDATVAWEMLSDGPHPIRRHARRECVGKRRHRLRVSVQCPRADCFVVRVKLQHRCETKINAALAQLSSQYRSGCAGESERRFGIGIKERANGFHWRQSRETFLKPLHTSAFLINRNQQYRVLEGLDLAGKREKLLWRGIVSCKKDNAPNIGVRQS